MRKTTRPLKTNAEEDDDDDPQPFQDALHARLILSARSGTVLDRIRDPFNANGRVGAHNIGKRFRQSAACTGALRRRAAQASS